MFTGIIEQIGEVKKAADTGEHTVFEIFTGTFDDLKLGDSVSVNGTCLTVTGIDADSFTVEMVNETKRITSLDKIEAGMPVNLERALTLSTRLGGHIVSGHVDGTGEITSVNDDGSALVMHIACPSSLMKYMVKKGSVAVDGISLTLFDVDLEASEIILNLVPETQERTTLAQKGAGDRVNIEADMLMKHVDHLLHSGGTLNIGALEEVGDRHV
ncbi:riboflavin synthase [Salinicoccus roseus]|uniref:riboflavin synthase n=1 Tax=Salinicoccus roseus TaxID=45670 RepID=UPI000F4F9507|nr:riboflavin synthase [Salinicoccus roseus]RPE55059.1 riboflavin synthase alpha chain [Salinicoccus roseus]GGA60418.1 riboflavin synthase subunit alpha [Salinicoccus roseus]